MASCLSMGSAGVGNWNISSTSSVFDAVRNMLNIETGGATSIEIAPPDFSKLNLNVPVSNTVQAALQDPGTYPAPDMPSGDFNAPSLEQIAYDAVASTTNYAFNAPLLSDIDYVSGIGHVATIDSQPDAPPLDYPQSDPLSVPDEPTGLTQDAPNILDTSGKPTLTPISFEAYNFSDLAPPNLGGLSVEYESPDVSEMPWQEELKYEDDGSLRSKVEELMSGNDEAGQWIQGLVQSALYTADTRRLALTTKRQVDNVFEETAARNFSLPSGPVERAVTQLSEEELNTAFERAEAVRDEVFDAAITAVTGAIGQSMQVERYHFGLYLRYVRQNIEVYRNNVALAVEAYNTLAQVIAGVQRVIRARVDAYNQYISGVEAENRAAAAQVEFSQAELDTYRARVGMFRADVGLQRKQAQVNQFDVRQQALVFDTYGSKLRGSLANLRIADQNVQAFREAIQAHGQYSQWFEEAIGAYEAAVSAEASKASVNESAFAAYQQLWRGEQTRMSSFEEYVQSSTAQFDAELRNYRSAAQAQQQHLSSANDSLRSSLQALSSYSSAAQQSQQHLGDYNTAKIGYTAASNEVDIVDSVLDMTRESITAEAETRYAQLDIAQESTKLTTAGALAQAASAIFGVRLAARGDSSERVSGRSSGGRRHSVQDRKSFSQSCTEVVRPATG